MKARAWFLVLALLCAVPMVAQEAKAPTLTEAQAKDLKLAIAEAQQAASVADNATLLKAIEAAIAQHSERQRVAAQAAQAAQQVYAGLAVEGYTLDISAKDIKDWKYVKKPGGQ